MTIRQNDFSRNISRGDVLLADLNPIRGSEQGGKRRVLVISNDIGNRKPNSRVLICVSITTQYSPKRAKMPMYVPLSSTRKNGNSYGLIDCFQIRALDFKSRIIKKLGKVSEQVMEKVDDALNTTLQLKTCPECNHVLLPNRNHCVNCKHILVRVCSSCHEKIQSEFNYCPHCGSKGEDRNNG